ncbi:hypothetical protein EHI8A_232220 [Entamoeba histolytica HM-1:IMSS-B]|uniref:Uncharacterized protein n=6 Tax=Entamoeba histolytica TaxID=5759 RepID=B1N4D8_ENTH1|nr:hypothetical protein EHI_025890 [Entamoeba histolytica HM-1:IMSS]EMD47901.1 Hypothetical protein EHI5A_106980 [Entamoeba histolytica KU27]EMH73579.1 hypothetical protein EHI8A_232220 [Entamoeba histolytica HM-1:IMSS-B]EMS13797.1 hypothetical protein KM1_129540 [Entamoeba histolytica HM-3:IMSS]ENY62298.1 hypothetical protein EHI7A_068850 [Entamoeba histolytica HM-1:IMSS-A]GAT98159.1 hypothetical protein CL6EHI_025890 [Entamoeba histolytica]|eukprot:XP_001914054.1 hypothetical protein EHI_025890 [Entamoeba histolytica HM-1:IMSS]
MIVFMLFTVLVSSQDSNQQYRQTAVQPTGIHPTTTEAMQYRKMMEKQDADQITSYLQQRTQEMADNFQRNMKNKGEMEMSKLKINNMKEQDNYRRKFVQFIKKDPYSRYVKELTDTEKEDLQNFRTFMAAADKPFNIKSFYGMMKRKENSDLYSNVGLKMNGIDGVFNGGKDWYKKRMQWLSKVGPGLDEESSGYLNKKFFSRHSSEDPKSYIGKNAPIQFA